MINIILFGVSLFLGLLLLILKALELRFEKQNFLQKLLSKMDAKSETLMSNFKHFLLQLIQSIRYIFLIKIPKTIKDFVEKIKTDLEHEYRVRQEIMLGRKDIANKGAVSFYLKKIREEKDGSKGSIE